MLCLGAAHIDETITATGPIRSGTSNPCEIATSCGGVAFNVAVGLGCLGHPVALCAPIGHDGDGERLRQRAAEANVAGDCLITRTERPTGRYVAALDPSGNLTYGFADTRLCETLNPGDLEPIIANRRDDRVWFIDTNLPEPVLSMLAARCPPQTCLIADSVSVAKAPRAACLVGRVTILRTNRAEAEAILERPGVPLVSLARALADRMAASIVLTDGAHGTVVVAGSGERAPAWLVPAPSVTTVDVTGAGDAATVGMIHGLAMGLQLADAAVVGHAAAAVVLCRSGAGFDAVTPALLADNAARVMPYLAL